MPWTNKNLYLGEEIGIEEWPNGMHIELYESGGYAILGNREDVEALKLSCERLLKAWYPENEGE